MTNTYTYSYDPLCNGTALTNYVQSKIQCPGSRLSFIEGCHAHVENSGNQMYSIAIIVMVLISVMMFLVAPVILKTKHVYEKWWRNLVDRDEQKKGKETLYGTTIFCGVIIGLVALSWWGDYNTKPMNQCPPLPSSIYNNKILDSEAYARGCFFYPTNRELQEIRNLLPSCRNVELSFSEEGAYRVNVGVVTAPEVLEKISVALNMSLKMIIGMAVLWIVFMLGMFYVEQLYCFAHGSAHGFTCCCQRKPVDNYAEVYESMKQPA